MKILLAIDDSPCSKRVIEAVGRRHWPAGTEMRILSVIEDPECAGEEECAAAAEKHGRSAANRCKRACQDLKEKCKEADIGYLVIGGGAAAQIIYSAQEWRADKVIIGAHGRTVCPHNFTGSVSRAVKESLGSMVEVIADAEPLALA